MCLEKNCGVENEKFIDDYLNHAGFYQIEDSEIPL